MRGFGQSAIDPTASLACIAQGGIPHPRYGCVPAYLYPQVRDCDNVGGSWDSHSQQCMMAGPPVATTGLAETVARIACAAMGGAWQTASQQCQTADQTYGIQQFHESALPVGTCPGAYPVKTPRGCYQPGIELLDVPPPPAGRPEGVAPVPGAHAQPQPGVPTPQPGPGAAAAAAAGKLPDWFIPAVIGAGAVVAGYILLR